VLVQWLGETPNQGCKGVRVKVECGTFEAITAIFGAGQEMHGFKSTVDQLIVYCRD
jgi:hypothetical protein